VRRRITRSILLVAALLVVGLGAPLAIVVQRFYDDRAVVDLQRRAAEATAELALPLNSENVARAARETDAPGAFSVYDDHGRLLFGAGLREADAPVLRALRGEAASDHTASGLVVATPITDRASERIIGAIRVTQPADLVAGQARRAWLLMGGVVSAAFIVALAIARSEARKLSEPIARLADQAVSFGRGELAARMEPSGIAEVDTVATALSDSAVRFAELLARERAFSADVSHQLRTPLAGLRLRLEHASRLGDQRPQVAGALVEVQRLEATVEQLLALARDAQPVSAALAVGDMLSALDERWRPRFAAASRELTVVIDERLPSVNASHVSIGQVLDVLLDNALGHGGGAVGVRARSTAGGLVIEVGDEGPGINDDRLGSVFDRGEGDGHGIGLALARTITEAEGGRLLAVSGRPPRFHLILTASS